MAVMGARCWPNSQTWQSKRVCWTACFPMIDCIDTEDSKTKMVTVQRDVTVYIVSYVFVKDANMSWKLDCKQQSALSDTHHKNGQPSNGTLLNSPG